MLGSQSKEPNEEGSRARKERIDDGTSLRSKIDQYRSKFIERSKVNNFDEQLSWKGALSESERRSVRLVRQLSATNLLSIESIGWDSVGFGVVGSKTNSYERRKENDQFPSRWSRSLKFTDGIWVEFVGQRKLSCSRSTEGNDDAIRGWTRAVRFSTYFVTTIVRDQSAMVFWLVLVQHWKSSVRVSSNQIASTVHLHWNEDRVDGLCWRNVTRFNRN